MNSLRKKLILAFVLSVVLPVTIVEFLTFSEARSLARDSFINSISGEVRQIDNAFVFFFKQIEDDVRYLSELDLVQSSAATLPVYLDVAAPDTGAPVRQSGKNASIYRLFREFGNAHTDLSYIYMGSRDAGYLQWPSGPLSAFYDPRQRPWYQTGLAGGGAPVRTNAYYWSPDDATIVSTVKPIISTSGETLGVLGMDVSLKGLTSLVQNIEYGNSGYLMLVEDSLNILVDTKTPANSFKSLRQVNGGSLAGLAGRPDGSADITIDGVDYLATIFTSPNLGWRFIGLIKTAEVEAASNSLRSISLTIVLISLVVFISLAVVFSASISTSIDNKHNMLIEARTKAEQASKAKSNFLSTISHEIRTPLNGILGMAQLVSDTKLNFEQKKQVNTILSSGKTLLSIINDVLDMSKIEADALELEETSFSLKKLVSGALVPFTMAAKDKGIRLIVDPLPHGLDVLVGDPVRLRQILWNLVSNAIKFTERGHVKICFSHRHHFDSASRHKHQIMLDLTVIDSGVGISSDRLDSIFEPFVQEDSSITRKYGGSGLGLAIVKRIVDLMGGSITADSQVQRGTCFSVSLPFRGAEESEITALLERRDSPEFIIQKGLRVLVAEDNPVNAAIAKSFLEKFGCNVEFAVNGVEAVSVFETYQPDLVLMDVHMPEMDGIEATQKIRALEGIHKTPIVGLTADVFTEHHKEFIKAGMDGVLTKPFTDEQLRQAVVQYTVRGPVLAIEDVLAPSASSQQAKKEKYEDMPIGNKEQFALMKERLGAETAHSLIEIAPTNTSNLLKKLTAGVVAEDVLKTAENLHALKGSVASLCAVRLLQMTKDMEANSSDFDYMRRALPAYAILIEETNQWWARELTEIQ